MGAQPSRLVGTFTENRRKQRPGNETDVQEPVLAVTVQGAERLTRIVTVQTPSHVTGLPAEQTAFELTEGLSRQSVPSSIAASTGAMTGVILIATPREELRRRRRLRVGESL